MGNPQPKLVKSTAGFDGVAVVAKGLVINIIGFAD
jgi:hypothetical protein